MRKLIAVVCSLGTVVFTTAAMPAGMSAEEMMTGYDSTVTFSNSMAAYKAYLESFSEVDGAVENTRQFAGSVGDRIAKFGVDLAEKLGNGAGESRKVGQFRYSTQTVSGYSTAEELSNSIKAMINDPSKTSYISCCGYATFCWKVVLGNKAPYGTYCQTMVTDNFSDIVERMSGPDEVAEKAKPGDLLFFDTSMGDEYDHAELYIGQYTGVDANGAEVVYESAMVGSNSSRNRSDAKIKPVHNQYVIYLVSLEKWLEKNEVPLDNNGQPIDGDTVEIYGEVEGIIAGGSNV